MSDRTPLDVITKGKSFVFEHGRVWTCFQCRAGEGEDESGLQDALTVQCNRPPCSPAWTAMVDVLEKEFGDPRELATD